MVKVLCKLFQPAIQFGSVLIILNCYPAIATEPKPDNRTASLALIKMGPYFQSCNDMLRRRWKPANAAVSPAVLATINKSGEVITAVIIVTSLNNKLDNQALAMVKGTRFPPFPEFFKENELKIPFDLDHDRKQGQNIHPNSASDSELLSSGSKVRVFMDDVKARLKRSWFAPRRQEYFKGDVSFRINTQGQVSGLRVDHSSGSTVADAAAVAAVQNAKPFSPLPSGISSPIEVRFIFGYDLFEETDGISLKWKEP